MTLTDPQAFGNLLRRLGDDPFSADVAVVSVAAHRDSAGTWSLIYGSVLLGPADMATSSWLDWRADSGEPYAGQAKGQLAQQGIASSSFADFVAVDGAAVGRERDAVLQPPRPEVVPSARVLERYRATQPELNHAEAEPI